MRYILALDTGGTKCEALLVREDGTAIGWGRCDCEDESSGTSWGGAGRSPESVEKCLSDALTFREFDELHCGLSPHYMASVRNLLPDYCEVVTHVVREWDMLFALADSPCGIAAVAGTGALILGRTRENVELHLDGLGPDLGDYGSGYQIGLMALRAVARSDWHERYHTTLSEPVLKYCGAGSDDVPGRALLKYITSHTDRSHVAAVSRIVDQEAEKGDPIALAILDDAAEGLASTIRVAVERLGMANDDYPLIGAGGVAQGSKIFWSKVCRRVRDFTPKLKPVLPSYPPVVGGSLAVAQQMEVDGIVEFRSKLLSSIEGVIRGV